MGGGRRRRGGVLETREGPPHPVMLQSRWRLASVTGIQMVGRKGLGTDLSSSLRSQFREQAVKKNLEGRARSKTFPEKPHCSRH